MITLLNRSPSPNSSTDSIVTPAIKWLRGTIDSAAFAEGNGKRSLKDRNRFLDIARGSSLECASIQDVLAATDGIDNQSNGELKGILKRIVSMLTRLIGRADVVSESRAEHKTAGEYEYRDAEYEYEHEEQPEPSRARCGLEMV